MTRRLAVHPVLVAAFPLLFLWGQNAAEVEARQVVAPLLLTVGVTLVVFGVASLALRDHRRGALTTSGLAFLFLSYGHVWDVVNPVIAEHGILLTVWMLLGIGVVASAVAIRQRLPELTGALNMVGALLLVTTLVPLIPQVAADAEEGLPRAAAGPDGGAEHAPVAGHRDIFYIVLDRYPRADVLEELFAFDNTAFTGFLEDRGFEVADRSVANYPKTAHSLAASLDLRYLDHLADTDRGEPSGPFDVGSSSWQPVYDVLRQHRLGRLLRERGYRYVHLGTWWDATRESPLADVNLRYGASSELTTVYEHTTPIPAVRAVLGREGDEDTRSLKRNATLFQFRELEELAAEDPAEPRFVFAHLTIPHEPYVFDADGDVVTREQELARSFRDNLVGQVIYANRRVSAIVERLLAGPDERDPIIVLQADEGPHPLRYRIEEEDFVWPRATDAELRQKLAILNAYHLPGLERSPVYETITPVNSFRMILSEELGLDLDLLPDRAFVFHDEDRLYDFTEVTDRVRGPATFPEGFRP